jgi:exopolyphosphatase/guanosine-5'-triphosphate,3'-diphosphate pyrophosphatase
VREARQRDRLVDALKRDFDVDLRILSGAAEARLGALAALRTLPLRRGVVLDLGGGSLQLSRVRGARIASAASVPLGAVRATRSFLRHDPPAPEEIQELRVELRAAVLGSLPPASRGGELVGLGGTIGALARMHLAGRPGRRRGRHGLSLALADVSALRERAAGQPLKRRRRMPGLSADHADVIVAGAVIVEELMRFGGYPRITVCGQRVRHGLLWSLAFPGAVRC